MSLRELTNELETFKKDFSRRAKETIKSAFPEFFAQFPEVAYLQWTQYTPYFNDGEPCVFGVRDIYAYLTKEGRAQFGLDPKTSQHDGDDEDEDEDEDEDDDDGEGDLYDLSSGWGDNRTYVSPRAKELLDAVDELNRFVQGIDEYMGEIYGDGVLVTVYRSGKTKTNDYHHD